MRSGHSCKALIGADAKGLQAKAKSQNAHTARHHSHLFPAPTKSKGAKFIAATTLQERYNLGEVSTDNIPVAGGIYLSEEVRTNRRPKNTRLVGESSGVPAQITQASYPLHEGGTVLGREVLQLPGLATKVVRHYNGVSRSSHYVTDLPQFTYARESAG